MDSAMFYTHAAIWCLGAIVAILALSACALWLAWHVYKEAIGWPTIVKAVKMYHAAQGAGAMNKPTDAELDSIDMDAKAIANQNPTGTPFAWRKAYLTALARAVLARWGTQSTHYSAAEFALQALVAAGHVSQELVDKAMVLPGAPQTQQLGWVYCYQGQEPAFSYTPQPPGIPKTHYWQVPVFDIGQARKQGVNHD